MFWTEAAAFHPARSDWAMSRSHIGWLIWFLAVLVLVVFLTSRPQERAKLVPSQSRAEYLWYMD